MQVELDYNELSQMIRNQNGRVFFVSGKSFEKTNILKKLNLVELSESVARFSQFTENPSIKEVMEGVIQFKESRANIIIAVGGGTAMDLAKLIKYYSNFSFLGNEDCPPLVNDVNQNLQLVAIPTTFGTGSESTHFAVLYVNGKKYSVADKLITPNYYLLDSELAISLPKHVKASACLDALCQAIESYWSVGSTTESKKFAINAIETISKNYESYLSEKETESAKNIAVAANLAGQAINITKTTAPHAISYTLTSKFNIPHGHAVALCIREFFRINLESCNSNSVVKADMAEIFNALCVNDAEGAKSKVNFYMQLGGLENSNKKLGVLEEESLETIVNNVNIERLKNHPIELKTSDIRMAIVNG
jgi:alcohol dehydrogenase class IV